MSYRLMYRFWLDMEKPDEEFIADKIEWLKNTRQFTATIRNGIRLICDLKQGKYDVLFELFPHLKNQLNPNPPAKSNGVGELKHEFDRLERLILQQSNESDKGNGLKPVIGQPP